MASPRLERSSQAGMTPMVEGSSLANFSGREAHLMAPVIAISRLLAPPTPGAGSGAWASGSRPHSADIKLAPVTPSTEA